MFAPILFYCSCITNPHNLWQNQRTPNLNRVCSVREWMPRFKGLGSLRFTRTYLCKTRTLLWENRIVIYFMFQSKYIHACIHNCRIGPQGVPRHKALLWRSILYTRHAEFATLNLSRWIRHAELATLNSLSWTRHAELATLNSLRWTRHVKVSAQNSPP